MKIGRYLFNQSQLERDNGVIIDNTFREVATCHVTRLEQAVFDQSVRTEEQPIARKRRQRLIRGVAIPRGSKRQGLPPRLTRLVETIDPLQRGWPDIADPVVRRQRCDVQQHTRCAVARWERGLTVMAVHACPSARWSARPSALSALLTIWWASSTMASRCASP